MQRQLEIAPRDYGIARALKVCVPGQKTSAHQTNIFFQLNTSNNQRLAGAGEDDAFCYWAKGSANKEVYVYI